MCGCGTRIGVLFALLTVVLPACQWNVGTVDVSLIFSPREGQNPLDPAQGVQKVRIRIEGEGLAPRVSEFEPGSDGKLSDVPVGKRVQVTVEGLDGIGVTLSRGVSLPFETRSGNNRVYLFIGWTGEFSEPPAAPVGDDEWSRRYTLSMWSEQGRAFHTASVLPDGTVLVAGGTWSSGGQDYLARLGLEDALDSAVRFDPTAAAFMMDEAVDCRFDPPGLCMTDSRAFHSASPYPGLEGLILLGGEPVVDLAESFDLDTLQFSTTSNSLEVPRSRHAATPLYDPDEGLLVAGGIGATGDLLPSVELLRPEGTFSSLSEELGTARLGAVAVAYDGGVLVIGGWERFDPWELGIPERVASDRVDRIVFEGEAARIDSIGPLLQARAEHTAVLVEVKKRDQDGNPVLDVDGDPVLVENVLVCGGLIDAVEATKTCELIDPEKGTVEQRGDVGTPRWRHTATVLPDGLVLIAGGFYGGARPSAYGTAEILDPDREQLNKRRAMMAQRGGHTATLMPNGMVLLAGGMANGSDMAGFDYEIFVP